MTKMLAMALGLVLAIAPLASVGAQWKPEIRFLKIGVSSAGGDWFRAGAKFSTMIPSVLPEVASSTVIGGGVVNVTRVGKGEAQIAFALTPYPEQGYKGESKHYPTPFKNVRLIASNLGRTVVVALVVHMATAWQAMRLGAVLFIVPFMFVYSPELLMIGSWPEILLAVTRAGIGIFCLAAGLQGWLRCRATALDRALLVTAGFLFVVPNLVAGAGGLILLALTWGLQSLRRASEIAPAPAASLD
jgi:hypothetical protein